MSQSTDAARQDLVQALSRGITPAYHMQSPPSSAPYRTSAVLILFGMLDQVPAIEQHGTVSPVLDVLLTRRADHMRHHAGQIAFPGGGAEPTDANLRETALREAAEETGLDPSGIDILGTLPPLQLAVSNNIVTPVIGWWRLPSPVAADRNESVEVFRVPVAELIDPDARGTSVLKLGQQTFKSPAFQLAEHFGGHLVWGFTSMLLSSIFDEVGWAEPWDANRTFLVKRTTNE